MSQNKSEFQEFASQLYAATDFNHAFGMFQKTVWNLGFDGVLYTYIPRVLLDTQFHLNPVYQVSEQYSPEYLAHYTDAQFERNDPLIQAVKDGVTQPIDWWGDINSQYMEPNPASREVIQTAKSYGINNGVTLPLLSGASGIAGASFISREQSAFSALLEDRIELLRLCTRLFHELVQNNACFKKEFVKPLLESLNRTEIQLLIGMATGKSQAQIASELRRSEGYLEQVMLKIRRKFSGVGVDESPTINRNQLLYYAGLLEIIQYSE